MDHQREIQPDLQVDQPARLWQHRFLYLDCSKKKGEKLEYVKEIMVIIVIATSLVGEQLEDQNYELQLFDSSIH